MHDFAIEIPSLYNEKPHLDLMQLTKFVTPHVET